MRLSTGFMLSLLGVTSQIAGGFSLRPQCPPGSAKLFQSLAPPKTTSTCCSSSGSGSGSGSGNSNSPKLGGVSNYSPPAISTVIPVHAITMRGGSKFSAASVRAGGGDEGSMNTNTNTNTNTNPVRNIANTVASLWAAGGVVMILGKSIKRILPIALEPFDGNSVPLSTFQLGSYIAMCLWFAYVEGYKGFQKKFSPLVVARAQTLQPFGKDSDRVSGSVSGSGSPIHHTLFGPFYAMGLFHATKKRKIVSWSVSIGVGLIVAAVKRLPYPWRNIVDAGVIVGLSWGSLSIVVEWFKAVVLGVETEMDPALPESK